MSYICLCSFVRNGWISLLELSVVPSPFLTGMRLLKASTEKGLQLGVNEAPHPLVLKRTCLQYLRHPSPWLPTSAPPSTPSMIIFQLSASPASLSFHEGQEYMSGCCVRGSGKGGGVDGARGRHYLPECVWPWVRSLSSTMVACPLLFSTWNASVLCERNRCSISVTQSSICNKRTLHST